MSEKKQKNSSVGMLTRPLNSNNILNILGEDQYGTNIGLQSTLTNKKQQLDFCQAWNCLFSQKNFKLELATLLIE